MHRILYLLVICLLIQSVVSQESPELAEEYIDEELPESAADPSIAAPKPVNETNEKPDHKAKFADDRFTQLFGPRSRNQPKPSSFFPKFASKPKPTLPPFIKRTPPIIRVSPTTQSPVQNQRLNQRTTATQRTTTTRTPSRGSNASNRRNQQNNNNNNNNNLRTATTSTTSSPVSDSSARRRFGGSNRRGFNSNATIPATTNRPRRN